MQNTLNLLRDKIDSLLDEEFLAEKNTSTVSVLNTEQTNVHFAKKTHLNNELLQPLKDITGYLGATLFNHQGELLTQHYHSDDTELIGTYTANMVMAMVKTLHSENLGQCQFIQMTANTGMIYDLSTVWAITDYMLLAVLLEPKSNIGLTKMLLRNISKNFGSGYMINK